MSLMERDKHEEILNSLLDKELEQSKRTELLQKLREDYTNAHTEYKELTESNEKLQADNSDLVVSNSKLFRQIGVTGDDKAEETESKKDFSETVTIENLENGGN